ncbi:MAG TPA: hypothetical protein VL995_20775 [Cellvibrio sp.]|nr:hypothetical protein [Cellvibrio sp.]
MSDSAPFDLLNAAARGETLGLAHWIEINRSAQGVPYELLAELVRNSKGCKKKITVLDNEQVQYGECLNEDGEPEVYIKRRSGTVKHIFKPVKKGKRDDELLRYRNQEILKKYESLIETESKEIVLFKLGQEYSQSPSSIESLVANRRRARQTAREDFLRLKQGQPMV